MPHSSAVTQSRLFKHNRKEGANGKGFSSESSRKRLKQKRA